MKGLEIKFSEIFYKKHGNKIFQDIINEIKLETKENVNSNYIDIVFMIAFFTYFGVTDINKICLLGNLDKNKCNDVKNIKELHKNSIFTIQRHIQNANNYNK